MNSIASYNRDNSAASQHLSLSTTPPRPHRLNPEFSVTRNGYHVRIVPSQGPLRDDIDRLVRRMYASRGLATDQPIQAERRRVETTLAACRGDRILGTLTVRNDAAHGLLADALYRTQIDAARRAGATVCEVGRLAMDREHRCHEALATLFQVGFLVARHAFGRTDSFIEVHPRHARFYSHMLGYRLAGPELTCPRVGAPAVLMHLPLAEAEQAALLQGERSGFRARNLYHLFMPSAAQKTLIADLLHAA